MLTEKMLRFFGIIDGMVHPPHFSLLTAESALKSFLAGGVGGALGTCVVWYHTTIAAYANLRSMMMIQPSDSLIRRSLLIFLLLSLC